MLNIILTKLFSVFYLTISVELPSVSSDRERIERSIKRLETARQKREGGRLLVRRPIGDKIDFAANDPFLMLDHMGPANYGPGEAVDAPNHPHRTCSTFKEW